MQLFPAMFFYENMIFPMILVNLFHAQNIKRKPIEKQLINRLFFLTRVENSLTIRMMFS